MIMASNQWQQDKETRKNKDVTEIIPYAIQTISSRYRFKAPQYDGTGDVVILFNSSARLAKPTTGIERAADFTYKKPFKMPSRNMAKSLKYTTYLPTSGIGSECRQ